MDGTVADRLNHEALSSDRQLVAARSGRTFRVVDQAGALAAGSGPAMTLEEIERWIGEHIKPGRR